MHRTYVWHVFVLGLTKEAVTLHAQDVCLESICAWFDSWLCVLLVYKAYFGRLYTSKMQDSIAYWQTRKNLFRSRISEPMQIRCCLWSALCCARGREVMVSLLLGTTNATVSLQGNNGGQ